MDQDAFGTVQRLECVHYGSLPGLAARDELDVQAAQSSFRYILSAFRDRDEHSCRAGVQQGFDRVPHDRLTAPGRELLGERLPGAQALTGGHDDGVERGEGSDTGHCPRALAACRFRCNALCGCPIIRHTRK